MKNAIATFVKEHPFLTYFIISEGFSMVRNTIVGVSQAVTGNYPLSRSSTFLDISDNDDETENSPEEESEEVVGDILVS